jgi:hypothetical protein
MRRRAEKKVNLRLLLLELLADAHTRSQWRAGNDARLMRAARLVQAVRSRLRAPAQRANQAAQAVSVDLLPVDLLLVPAVVRVRRATSAPLRPVRSPNFLHIDGA